MKDRYRLWFLFATVNLALINVIILGQLPKEDKGIHLLFITVIGLILCMLLILMDESRQKTKRSQRRSN